MSGRQPWVETGTWLGTWMFWAGPPIARGRYLAGTEDVEGGVVTRKGCNHKKVLCFFLSVSIYALVSSGWFLKSTVAVYRSTS
jgi:hypothetical protein